MSYEVETEYFNLAVAEWQEVEATLASAYTDATALPRIPLLWSGLGSLNEAVDRINELASVVRSDLLRQGSLTMVEIAQTVREIGNNYIGVEEDNTEIASTLPQPGAGGGGGRLMYEAV